MIKCQIRKLYKYDQAIYIGNSQFNKMNSIATILILGTFSVSTLAQSLRNNSHPNIHVCPPNIDDIDRVSTLYRLAVAGREGVCLCQRQPSAGRILVNFGPSRSILGHSGSNWGHCGSILGYNVSNQVYSRSNWDHSRSI